MEVVAPNTSYKVSLETFYEVILIDLPNIAHQYSTYLELKTEEEEYEGMMKWIQETTAKISAKLKGYPAKIVVACQDGLSTLARLDSVLTNKLYTGKKPEKGFEYKQDYSIQAGKVSYGLKYCPIFLKTLEEACQIPECQFILNSGKYPGEADTKVRDFIEIHQKELINKNVLIWTGDKDFYYNLAHFCLKDIEIF
jgi:hypothetical protein